MSSVKFLVTYRDSLTRLTLVCFLFIFLEGWRIRIFVTVYGEPSEGKSFFGNGSLGSISPEIELEIRQSLFFLCTIFRVFLDLWTVKILLYLEVLDSLSYIELSLEWSRRIEFSSTTPFIFLFFLKRLLSGKGFTIHLRSKEYEHNKKKKKIY